MYIGIFSLNLFVTHDIFVVYFFVIRILFCVIDRISVCVCCLTEFCICILALCALYSSCAFDIEKFKLDICYCVD